MFKVDKQSSYGIGNDILVLTYHILLCVGHMGLGHPEGFREVLFSHMIFILIMQVVCLDHGLV